MIRVYTLNVISAASCKIFVLLLILLHLSNNSLDAISQPISIYYYGSKRYLFIAALTFFGLSEITTSFVIHILVEKSKNVLFILFLTFGISAILIAFLPMDLEPKLTLPGIIHVYAAAIHFLLYLLATYLVVLKQKASIFKTLSTINSLMMILFFGFILIITSSHNSQLLRFYGLLQRILVLQMSIWLIWFNLKIWSMKTNYS